MADQTSALTSDHKRLDDDPAARRYFDTFARITGHMATVASEMETDRSLSLTDVAVLRAYVAAVAATFRALSVKYRVSGRLEGVLAKHLTIDLHESGFPVFQELATLANDAAQAQQHLQGMATAEVLKGDMIRQIVTERTVPTRLQYAMSQRVYFDLLVQGGLFWPQMHPQALWIEDVGPRRKYLIHWGVYDSQQNLPMLYLLDVEDSGKKPLPNDDRRWPQVQAHLLAQSVGGLKLVTIAKGFDEDFADLHPKRLRRLHLGPMYSSEYTVQTGPIREVLENAKSAPGEDWALAWTLEELVSERVEKVDGWFSETDREVFLLDPLLGAERGNSRQSRSVMLPQRAYQVLAERNPEGFRGMRKYVVGREGRVISYD